MPALTAARDALTCAIIGARPSGQYPLCVTAARFARWWLADSGQTFPAVLVSAVPNAGVAHVISPNLPTSTARIGGFSTGNIFFDISPGNFTIITDDIFKDGLES